MKPTLNDLFEGLRNAPVGADLSNIEPRVWARIGREREDRWAGVWFAPARAGAIALALGAGTALGAAHAREVSIPREVAVFEVASALAPSTLLDER